MQNTRRKFYIFSQLFDIETPRNMGSGSFPPQWWMSTAKCGTCGSRRPATGKPARSTSPTSGSVRTASARQRPQVRSHCLPPYDSFQCSASYVFSDRRKRQLESRGSWRPQLGQRGTPPSGERGEQVHLPGREGDPPTHEDSLRVLGAQETSMRDRGS